MVVFPPSCDVAPVEEARNVNVVLLHGILKFVGTEEAIYDALNHFWRMIGGGADVVIEVHWLLISFSQNEPILDIDCEIKEIHRL